MNIHEQLAINCKHQPTKPIFMGGKLMHWRCACGKIVPPPKTRCLFCDNQTSEIACRECLPER